jgi:glutaminyl-tRNA synthetase
MTDQKNASTTLDGAVDSSTSSNFIRSKIAHDLKEGKHGGRVHTRFPPEPNGYLHIGHAKSICLNFGVAAENSGLCNLRFDDTNPEKESQEYVDAIKDSISWLGFQWSGNVRYSSSYFEQLYAFALQLIESGKAYVCDLGAIEMREYRGSLTEPGQNSPHRDRPIEENRDLFERMRAGELADGACSLRAKIDMASPNINMRDPVLYRIRHIEHHQTGSQWCIYPTYDYTHCISDAIEGITHSLCTLEFEGHRPLYDWILNTLDIASLAGASDLAGTEYDYVLPQQSEFAKLKLNYTIVGKRTLKEMVETNVVQGWDDPRMPTLAGLRRRGFTATSIRNFCESVGVARSDSIVDLGMLEHAIRDDLDKNSPRAMCVLNPVTVVLTNLPDEHLEILSMANHPKDEEMGRRSVPLTKRVVIDRSDFEEVPPQGFKRLIAGGEVRLRGAYVIKCIDVIKDDTGKIIELHCSVDLNTLGKKPEGRKVKGVIHWVSEAKGIPLNVRLYDRLFNVENPESKDIEDFRECLNKNSLVEITSCIAEPSIVEEGASPSYQFEREGYYCLDEKDSSENRLVFNRTITLRDSW